MSAEESSIPDATLRTSNLIPISEEEIVFEKTASRSSTMSDVQGGSPAVGNREDATILHTGTIEDSLYSYDFESGEAHKKTFDLNEKTDNVSLRQVVQHSPLEYEAETYILKALEETEPTIAEQTILGLVPNDVCHNFTQNDNIHKTSSEMQTFLQKRKDMSTSENLRNLTTDFLRLQEELEIDDNKRRRSTIDETFETNENGPNITQQRKIVKERSGADIYKQDQIQKANARKNWSKLKIAVAVTSSSKPVGVGDVERGHLSKDEYENNDTSDEYAGEESHDTEEGELTASSRRKKQKHGKIKLAALQFKTGFKDFEEWVKFKKTNIVTYIKYLLFLIIPATGVASIFFYWGGNPPCGTSLDCRIHFNSTSDESSGFQALLESDDAPSYSWWILFVCVRHALLITLAGITQAIMIDFLCIRSKFILKVAGPAITLYTVQSKGMPFILSFWGIYSFLFLYGNDRFANHWLFWQDAIDMFNDTNPSGGVTSLDSYKKFIILAFAVGVATSVKRFWVALFLGRQTYHRYASDLAILMKKILFIGKLARLGSDIEKYGFKASDFKSDHDFFVRTIKKEEPYEVIDSPLNSMKSGEDDALFGDENHVGRTLGYAQSSTRMKIEKLLGAWEEPKESSKKDENVNIGSIIQFRTSLAVLNTPVPFSSSFGLASTRMQCIESSENLFRRLLLATQGNQVLDFDVIALIARNDDGDLDEKMTKELIKLFRPDRDGNLTLIDFAKSVDAVYKEFRLLRASVSNNSRMDKAFENINNVFYWIVTGCIVLSVLGVDPLVMFASISGFVLGFAFMIGSASSKYFEGILLILIRRPYDIGDRIHVSDPNSETSSNGSLTWFVRDVTLFTTTVCFAATNEVATYSNGSLASSRIINAARSPEASVHFPVKFPISAPYEKLRVFGNAIEEFVKARPREYLSFGGCRCSRIEADLGYVEYCVAATHRESWQNMRAILMSKAELSSFALELSKKMKLRYQSPPMPVDVRLHSSKTNAFGFDLADVYNAVNDQSEENVATPNKDDDIHEVFKIFDKK